MRMIIVASKTKFTYLESQSTKCATTLILDALFGIMNQKIYRMLKNVIRMPMHATETRVIKAQLKSG